MTNNPWLVEALQAKMILVETEFSLTYQMEYIRVQDRRLS